MRWKRITLYVCCEWCVPLPPYLLSVVPSPDMNGHINETAPPLVPIGEVKLVQVQIVVWFVRTCEVWIPFVFCLFASMCLVDMYVTI
jgi:hypothetical protein